MDIEQLWEQYLNKDNVSEIEQLDILFECAKQDEDTALKRVALYELGDIHYMGKGVEVDKESGKILMQQSADLGYGPAMNLYGQMLTYDGDLTSIEYFGKALLEGEILPAKNLNEIYIACAKANNSYVCEIIDNEVKSVINICQEKIRNAEDEYGKPQLTLAIVGLYGIGKKFGIDQAAGQTYLQQAVDKKNVIASVIQKDPALSHAETVNEFKPETTTNSQAETSGSTESTNWTLGDIIVILIVGVIGGGIVNLIFHTGFFVPFLIFSAIALGLSIYGSK